MYAGDDRGDFDIGILDSRRLTCCTGDNNDVMPADLFVVVAERSSIGMLLVLIRSGTKLVTRQKN